MIDTASQKPLLVSTEYPLIPYITLPISQVDEVRRLLDSRNIGYWVDEIAISFNGDPEETVINLNRGTDAVAVQAILDSVP